MGQHKKAILVCCSLVVLVFIVFGRALNAEFVPFDDETNIYRNPHLGPPTIERLGWMFTDFSYQWRYQPLSWLTWSFIYSLFGLNPLPYHLANLLLHAANACLVYFLLRLILRRATHGAFDESALSMCSALAAGIWALHPLRVETVAWAVELLYCQSLFCLLISYLCYLRTCDGSQRMKWLLASLVAFAASLFSFPLGLAYPAVLVVSDIFLFKTLRKGHWVDTRARQAWLEKAPFVGLSLAAAWLNLYARTHALTWPGPVGLEVFGMGERVMQALYIWAYYVWKPFFPFALSPVYTQLMYFKPADSSMVLSAMSVVGISAAVFFLSRRKYPLLTAVWVCHLALLVPVLGLTEHPHYPSDRYSLAVSVAWTVLLAFGMLEVWKIPQLRRFVVPVSGVVLAALAMISREQTTVWQNGETLFTTIIDRVQDDRYLADPLVRRANWYTERGQFSKAEADLRTAAKHQTNWQLNIALGQLLAKQGKMKEAIASFTSELDLNPRSVPALVNIALANAAIGDVSAAKSAFSRAWETAPQEIKPQQRVDLYRFIAVACLRSGEKSEAAEYIRLALKVAEPLQSTELMTELRAQLVVIEQSGR